MREKKYLEIIFRRLHGDLFFSTLSSRDVLERKINRRKLNKDIRTFFSNYIKRYNARVVVEKNP